MSDLLAIVDPDLNPEELVAEIIRRHPDRVTLLIEDDGRFAPLRAAIEARSGAVVVGLANSREQLRGWRFDRVIGGRPAQPAIPV